MTTPKIIFITGCSTGIGHTTAEELKKRGHRVICSARKPEDVLDLQNQGFESVQLDLADSQSVQLAVQSLLNMTDGRIDALFNNGAYGQFGALEDLSREALRKQFETNLFGTHELTNLLLPVMRKQGFGRIVYNSSVLGFVAMKFCGAYNASKYAIEGLADTLRLELQGSGVSVVLIEPGPITSNFRQNAFNAYGESVDMENSVHHQEYLAMQDKFQNRQNSLFTLPATAVAKKVIHAIESSHPKIRYRVTVPTHVIAILKRLLPDAWLDWVLVRGG